VKACHISPDASPVAFKPPNTIKERVSCSTTNEYCLCCCALGRVPVYRSAANHHDGRAPEALGITPSLVCAIVSEYSTHT